MCYLLITPNTNAAYLHLLALALSTVSLPDTTVVKRVVVVINTLPQADLAPLPKVLKEAEEKERQQQQQQQLGEHAMDLDSGPAAPAAPATAVATAAQQPP